MDQLVHDRLRAPVVVAKQHRVTALSFNNGRYVGRPCSFLKIIKSASQWPNAWRELTSSGRFRMAHSIERRDSGFARISGPALPASFRQISRQLLILAFLRVDIPIDRLMAQPRLGTTRQSDPSRNLFRRPTLLQTLNDGRAQKRIAQQFAILTPASHRQPMRCHMPVAFGDRDLSSCQKLRRSSRQMVERSRPSLRAISAWLIFFSFICAMIRRSSKLSCMKERAIPSS